MIAHRICKWDSVTDKFATQIFRDPGSFALVHCVHNRASVRLSRPVIQSKSKTAQMNLDGILLLAGGQGLEPRYSGPKPDVLPLDDPPIHGIATVCVPIKYAKKSVFTSLYASIYLYL